MNAPAKSKKISVTFVDGSTEVSIRRSLHRSTPEGSQQVLTNAKRSLINSSNTGERKRWEQQSSARRGGRS